MVFTATRYNQKNCDKIRGPPYRSNLSTQRYKRGMTQKTTSLERVLDTLALVHEIKISLLGRKEENSLWMEQGREDVTAASPSSGAAAAGHGWDELLIQGSAVLSHLATWKVGGTIPPYFTSPEKMERAVQGPPNCHSPS